MSDSAAIVVCDAGPLIHLDELNCITLLADFESVLVPDEVWREVERHRPAALEKTGVAFQKISGPVSESSTFKALVKSLSLDLGEQAALTVMESRPAAIFLTDDAAARLAAMTLNYQVHGTIGIILRAIRRGQKSKQDVLKILSAIPEQSTLFIRPRLLAEVIDRVKAS